MAATFYVDGINGLDSNNGTTWGLAKKTIVGMDGIPAAGDLVLIAPGVYLEIDHEWASVNNVVYRRDPAQPGHVIVDFNNRQGTQGASERSCNWRVLRDVIFFDIHFRNPYESNSYVMLAFMLNADVDRCGAVHCVFYQRDGAANVGQALAAVSRYIGFTVENCTFENLNRPGHHGAVRFRNNYLFNVTSAWSLPQTGSLVDYNAWAGNTETNGINTSVGASPGLVDAANEDFRVDPATVPADYVTFMKGGMDGDRIGAFGGGGFYYNPTHPQFRFISQAPTAAQGNPQPAWEDDTSYVAGTPTAVIENGSFELELDLATVPLATGGRVMTDVFTTGAGVNQLESVALGAYEDLPGGAALDIDTTLPQVFEYRSSDTTFLKGAGTPTWTSVARGAYLNLAHEFHQLRIEMRTDHTNA